MPEHLMPISPETRELLLAAIREAVSDSPKRHAAPFVLDAIEPLMREIHTNAYAAGCADALISYSADRGELDVDRRDGLECSIVGTSSPMVVVAAEVLRERVRQEAKWGQQNHPDGTGPGLRLVDSLRICGPVDTAADLARAATKRTDWWFANGRGTYEQILTEEYAEALAEEDPARLRAELVQVAAVAAAWVEKIDRDVTRAQA